MSQRNAYCGLFCQHGSLADKISYVLDIDFFFLLEICLFFPLLLRSENGFRFPVMFAPVWLLYPTGSGFHILQSLCHFKWGRPEETLFKRHTFWVNVPLTYFYPLWFFPGMATCNLSEDYILRKNNSHL